MVGHRCCTFEGVRHRIVVYALALLMASCGGEKPEKAAQPAPAAQPRKARSSAYPDEFWKHWQDGKSEVSTYAVTMRDRSRKATAIVVFALERFSDTRRVSVEQQQGTDVPAMKMNVIREYGPGKGAMLTVFAALEAMDGHPPGYVRKIMLSSHSWAGQSSKQLILTGRRGILSWQSHTEAEGSGTSTRTFEDPDSLPDEALPLCARRMSWPILRLGQRTVVPAFPFAGGQVRRILVSLPQDRQTTVVPAGSFRTHRFTAGVTAWDVEGDSPHRIIRWQSKSGEEAVLLGSERVDVSKDATEDLMRRLSLPMIKDSRD